MSEPLFIDTHEPDETSHTNLIVLAALTILLIVTIAIAFLQLPGWIGLLIAMTIAAAKAVLILTWFMHLKFSPRLVIAAAVAGFLWLGILFALIFNDYAFR